MLVLTRKSDETIMIGSQIEVRVLAIKGNRVTIGIEAPQNIRITRGELPVWPSEDFELESLVTPNLAANEMLAACSAAVC